MGYALGSGAWGGRPARRAADRKGGFPYDKHLPSAVGDGRTIGLAWLQNEADKLRSGEDMPFTYALVDLGKAQALRDTTDALAAALMGADGPLNTAAGRQQVQAASVAADRYDSSGDGAIRIGGDERDADHYVDLGSFAGHLAQQFEASSPGVAQAARAVGDAIEQAVVARAVQNGTPWRYPDQRWSWSPQTSLSIYLPLHHGDWRLRYYRLILFGADGQWGAMINGYWQRRGTLAPNYIPPATPFCDADCPPPFGQLLPKRLVYLPLVIQ